MKPPSKTELESNEVYNPWPEFDMQTKEKNYFQVIIHQTIQ